MMITQWRERVTVRDQVKREREMDKGWWKEGERKREREREEKRERTHFEHLCLQEFSENTEDTTELDL